MLKSIPVLALIPVFSAEFAARYKSLGITDFLMKPIEESILSAKLNQVLRGVRLDKLQANSDAPTHLRLERSYGMTKLQFLGDLRTQCLADIKHILTPTFLKNSQKDQIVLDLSLMPELPEKDLAILEHLVSIFLPRKISILAAGNMQTISRSHSIMKHSHLYFDTEQFDEAQRDDEPAGTSGVA